MTLHKWILGKKLYYDKILSSNGTVACASCHAPDKGFTDQSKTSLGIHEQLGGMNAPTVIDSAYNRFQFWDGRAQSLEDQAQGPVQNPLEMFSAETKSAPWDEAVKRLRKDPGMVALFEQVFGHAPTRDAAAKAIAAYERTVLVGNSIVDRADVAMRERCEDEGDFSVLKNAVSAKDVRSLEAIGFEAGTEKEVGRRLYNGRELYFGKANCNTCHAGDTFTDHLFHNLGVGLADGTLAAKDLGRFAIEPLGHKNTSQIGAFKTPTLRALLDTAPYMHDGSEATLEAVVEFYDKGGNANEFLDLNMRDLKAEAAYNASLVSGEKYEGPKVFLCGPNQVPIVPKKLNLSKEEKADLVLFLKALQGDAVAPIVADPEKLPELN
jgi:cytochrome c peroxidase